MPFASARAARLVPAESFPSAPGNAGRLLVVDDLPDNRALLSRRFMRHGFEIVEAESGEEALQLVQAQAFDAVLLDVMMPGLDGNETLSRIRLDFAPAALPVIMVTARTQSEDIVESLTRGANDYITKPIDFNIALARVTNQVSMRRARAELHHSNEALRSANEAIQAEVARRTASEQKTAYLARYDVLTGLPNRFTFDEQLQKELRTSTERKAELSLLFLDLDDFKNVNDALGHAVGDELLKAVADEIVGTLGEGICARVGGDEFAIIHVSDDVSVTAAVLAQRLIATVGSCQLVAGRQVFVGASIGVAVARRGEHDAATLLRHADLAMYHAKADGRRAFRFFETEMEERVQSRRALEIDLRRALPRSEFEVHYQPVVDVRRGRIVGAEALVRWRNSERGLVSPADFIPVAEDTGLILSIGEWVLRKACDDAAKWPEEMRVAVNLSAVQFRNPKLFSVVVSALSSAGLAPERLELEITESVILNKNSDNVRLLTKLRKFGVRIALDDFGTGYSGLGYFRTFHFDRIKIDQTFVREMQDEPTSRAIIRAAIRLCTDLRMSITAEGVETLEQLNFLSQEGCSVMQGYFFGKPQPHAEFERSLLHISSRTCPTLQDNPV